MARRGDVHGEGRVTVVDRTDADGGSVDYGLTAFYGALSRTGVTVNTVDHWTEADRETVVVVGTINSRPVSRLLGDVNGDPEKTIYRWCETGVGTALVAAGTDERGLMYALLELSERIDADGIGALSAVDERTETPDNAVRGVDRFLMGPVQDGWFYDDEFWEYYLARLARCRFNRLVLVTGYNTAFMSPPYPFVVDVPGYPDVRVSEEIEESREEHRERLRAIGRLCHRRGLEFFLGIWQQRPFRLGSSNTEQSLLIEGLPDDVDALSDYCTAGVRELLVACPEIDGVQFRVNFEGGIGDRSTATAFWGEMFDAVADAEDERGREIKLDPRAKGMTDELIERAMETGLEVTIPTKFTWESTGLPYHPLQMRDRELSGLDDPNLRFRYSYADLLRAPRGYDVLYRLWTIGTNRVFVWGDPDYARRFSGATQFGDSIGFEITPPLSGKGGFYFLQDEPWPLFDDPDLRDYEWEDERYWAWYRLFGRLGYSIDADSDVWMREFEARFGSAAEPLARASRAASKVLPLLTSAHQPRHPAWATWTARDTGGALFAGNSVNPSHLHPLGDRDVVTYDTAEPGDPGLFYAIDEYVSDRLADDLRAKYTPIQVRRWLRRFAAEARAALDAAEQCDCESGEYRATVLDLSMVADLASYHAAKITAAVWLRYYRETDDASYLPAAHEAMRDARDAWARMADRGSEAYHDDLVFGWGPESADTGQWDGRLAELDADLDDLGDRLDGEGVDDTDVRLPAGGRAGPYPSFAAAVPETCPAGEDLELTVRVGELPDLDGLQMYYRRADQTAGDFEVTEMAGSDRVYRGVVPGTYIAPEWNLLVYFAAIDDVGNTIVLPGLYHAEAPMPYYVVDVTE